MNGGCGGLPPISMNQRVACPKDYLEIGWLSPRFFLLFSKNFQGLLTQNAGAGDPACPVRQQRG
jgi:hypothetical protein